MTTPNSNLHVLEPYRGTRRMFFFEAASHGAVYLEARKALRLSAIAADTKATTEISLSLLWRQLARGASRVVDGFFSERRCYLVLSLNSDGAESGWVKTRRMEILSAVLCGARQKNVAIDLALAASTVAMSAKLALENLGVNGKPSRAHPLLMLAARAVHEPSLAFARCSTLLARDDRDDRDGRDLRVIGISRPERCMSGQLPSAELAIVRSLVEGLSHEEIARLRRTSTRTVANQIGAVFRRFQVSGRNELVQRLFSEQGLQPRAPSPATLVPPAMAEPKLQAGLDEVLRYA